MAAMNKYLAQSNKSSDGGRATKKREIEIAKALRADPEMGPTERESIPSDSAFDCGKTEHIEQ
jgi:hypothetical protein